MPDAALLFNGNYHVTVIAAGICRAQCCDLAEARWREDTVFDDCGTFQFVREEVGSAAASLPVPLDPSALDRSIATLSSIAVGVAGESRLAQL